MATVNREYKESVCYDLKSNEQVSEVEIDATLKMPTEIHNERATNTIVTKQARYTLNKSKAISNKLKACNREHFSAISHKNNLVITMNTATFEFFKKILISHLQMNKEYKVVATEMRDGRQDIPADIIRVFEQGKTMSSHLFTITLYRTKCRALVNGPHLKTFHNEDLPPLEKQIQEMRASLNSANSHLKSAISNYINGSNSGCYEHPNVNRPPVNQMSLLSNSNVNTVIAEGETSKQAGKKGIIKTNRKRKVFDDKDVLDDTEKGKKNKIQTKNNPVIKKVYSTRSLRKSEENKQENKQSGSILDLRGISFSVKQPDGGLSVKAEGNDDNISETNEEKHAINEAKPASHCTFDCTFDKVSDLQLDQSVEQFIMDTLKNIVKEYQKSNTTQIKLLKEKFENFESHEIVTRNSSNLELQKQVMDLEMKSPASNLTQKIAETDKSIVSRNEMVSNHPTKNNDIGEDQINISDKDVDTSDSSDNLDYTQGLMIKNIANQVSQGELDELLGIANNEYLRKVCSCKLSIDESNESSSANKYAILTVPKSIGHEIMKINKIELYNQVIDIRPLPLEPVGQSEDQQLIAVKKKSNGDNNLNSTGDMEALSQIKSEIRQYSMKVCKMMKRKLLYLDRKHFKIRHDKGSTAREQIYIDCSTSIYEYFRYCMIEILKDKMKCTEDLQNRKVVTDEGILKKSEVEAQYLIYFSYKGTPHKVYITFYYTKCSLWIQGSSSKINNLTVAQFFAYNYLENIAKMIENSIPLQDLGEELRIRINSFLTEEEMSQLMSGKTDTVAHKCVTCSKNCQDNNKSMICSSCKQKQHFNCARLKLESEREKFLTGKERFICSKCLPIYTIEGIDSSFEEQSIDEDSNWDMSNNLNPAPGFQKEETSGVVNFPSQAVAPQNTPPEQNSESATEVNMDKVTIKRMQQEMIKMREEHTNKHNALNEEIDTLREAYRRCMADYEKEKETRETLQKCLNALQQNQNACRPCLADDETEGETKETRQKSVQELQKRAGHKGVSGEPIFQTTESADTTQPNQPSQNSAIPCKFFNTPEGCKKGNRCDFPHITASNEEPTGRQTNGTATSENKNNKLCKHFNSTTGCKRVSCMFTHKLMPPCNRGPHCSLQRCGFDHKESSHATGTTAGVKSTETCRFYNKKEGCNPKDGRQCRFRHIDMPPCRNGPDCRKKSCKFCHSNKDLFRGGQPQNRPPELSKSKPQQQLDNESPGQSYLKLQQLIDQIQKKVDMAKNQSFPNTRHQMNYSVPRMPQIPVNYQSGPMVNSGCKQDYLNPSNKNVYQPTPMLYRPFQVQPGPTEIYSS